MAFPRSTDRALPGVLLSYFVGMHYPAFLGAERLRHVLKVFATFYLLFYLFEPRTIMVGWTTWLLPGHVNRLIRVYATAETHDRQRTLDVEGLGGG